MYFLDSVFKNPVNGGKLAAISGPSSGTTRSGANMPVPVPTPTPTPSTGTTSNNPSCEMIDPPAENGHRSQDRPVDAKKR